jgi:hypothetical protein
LFCFTYDHDSILNIRTVGAQVISPTPLGGILQSPKDKKPSHISLGVSNNAPESDPPNPSSPKSGNQRKASRMGKLIKVVAEDYDAKVFILFFFSFFFNF